MYTIEHINTELYNIDNVLNNAISKVINFIICQKNRLLSLDFI